MHYLSRRTWIWVKTMYFRITLSKVVTCFFLFSFMHCFTQGIVQSVLFSLDMGANSLVSGILSQAQIPQKDPEIAWLVRRQGNFTLSLCKDVPVLKKNEQSCELIFQTGAGPIPVPTGFRKRTDETVDSGSNSAHTIVTSTGEAPGSAAFVNPVANSSGFFGVDFSSNSVNGGSTVFLSGQCTRVLIYANQVLNNSRREELALIGSEFWMLGISVFAIMYDSIPHLLAGFFLRVLSTGWSGYSIWRTLDIHIRFQALITNGACGVDLFPGYSHKRVAVQIADLSLNFVALVLSCYMVWKLVRTFATCMFKRVGAPGHLIRVYRLFLGVFICLQMSVYLLVASTSLWIDQLINGPLAKISWHNHVYLGSFIIANVVLLPWIAMGWFAARREKRRTMLAFLCMGALYVIGWGIMYYSQVFRWTWIQWPFFASLSVAAQIVQLASVVLGVVCKRNFHRGLAQYLNIDDTLARADFEPEVFPHVVNGDIEKHAFEVDFKVVSLETDDTDSFDDANPRSEAKRDTKISSVLSS
ncbi:hypothetical protein M0805_005342 [Coniferiporia weirii]|nr:hypothetical protein M0805_005342 [Coniferiporia weirii]